MRQYWIRWFGWLIFWLCYGPLYWGGYSLILWFLHNLPFKMIYFAVQAEMLKLFLWGIGGIVGSIIAVTISSSDGQSKWLVNLIFWVFFWFCFLYLVAFILMAKSPAEFNTAIGIRVQSIMPIIIYGATGGVLGNFLIERVLKRHF